MTPEVHEKPRYSTVQDYVRVLRRHRRLIALVAVICVAGALGLSLVQDPTYTATVQMSFRDPLSDLNIVGPSGEAIPELPASQRSSQQAKLITRPQVSRRVLREIDSPAPAGQIVGSITARVDATTNLVVLQASWSDPDFAAELANTYAEQAKLVAEKETLARLEVAEDAILVQLREARDDLPEVGAGIRVSVLEQSLSNVRSLRDVAQPARIATAATPPGSPTSPKTTQNAILGGVLGLVVGILLAFVRDSLDRRLHSVQEIHDELGLPVLGRIGEAAFNYTGLVANGRPPMAEPEFEGFRVLRMNLGYLGDGEPIRTVLVTSPLPEEGKSTVSVSLASAAALAGQRVLLVECDLHRPSFHQRLGIQREPGLSDYLVGRSTPSDVLQVVSLSSPTSFTAGAGATAPDASQEVGSMACIAAGSPVATSAELLQTERFHHFLRKVGSAYELVVLDGGPLLAIADPLEIIPFVNGVLVCIRVQQTTRDQARAVRAALGHLPERPAGAVVTGIGQGDPEAYDYYYGY